MVQDASDELAWLRRRVDLLRAQIMDGRREWQNGYDAGFKRARSRCAEFLAAESADHARGEGVPREEPG
jgi:hypothetical protein